MIKQDEGSSGTPNPDESVTVLALPPRPQEAKEVTGGVVQNHNENEAGKRHGEESKESHHNCIIDIKSSGESVDGEDSSEEKVCRICHLSSEHQSIASDLIQLGCRCKDELGISHRDCAEIWFMHRGNR